MKGMLTGAIATLAFSLTSLVAFAYLRSTGTSDTERSTTDGVTCDLREETQERMDLPRQGHPEYNPVALAKGGVDPFDLFDRETVDAAWARAMEQAILPQLVADASVLSPHAKDIEVVCKFATCRLSLSVPSDSMASGRSSFTVAQFGDGTAYAKRSNEHLGGGWVRASAIVLFHETREPALQATSYIKKRELFVEHMDPSDPVYGPLVAREKLALKVP